MNSEENSGFEEDSDNNLFFDKVKSQNSSSSAIAPDSVKEEILPVIPLPKPGISLEPDMLFGWRPKALILGGPVPFNFTIESIPAKGAIFHGFRPDDSLDLHETFSGPDSYPFFINPTVKHAYQVIKKDLNNKDCRPFIGMKSDLSDEVLRFDSKFESGNLDKVVKANESEYDLYIRNDTNSYGKNQWFYFRVANSGEEKEMKFNIVNFCKRSSLYSQGLQPWVFYESQPQKGWNFISRNVKYAYSKVNKSMVNKRIFYCLSFEFTFPACESLYFAYSIPYTYTDLLRYLKTTEPSVYVKREILCKSLSGIDVPLLTITDPNSKERKETVIVTARVHPGETHGSWLMQGFLSYLLSREPVAVRLRQLCIFKIVPMLNPDGVIVGNSRCSQNGQDLNRQFQSPDSRLHPEIHSLKNMIFSIKDILTYLDFHAHSKKKGVFFYGPYFPLHSEYHCKIRVIPKLLSEVSECFRYYSCKFRNDWSKRRAARLVVSKEHQLHYSYTVEASSFGFLNTERATVPFDVERLQKMGESILIAVLQYIELRNDENRVKEAKAEIRLMKNPRLSPVKDSAKRTMEDLLDLIKNDLKNEDESDSGGSNSDCDNEQEEENTNKKILNLFKQVNQLINNPLEYKRYSHSQAPKVTKPPKKEIEIEIQAKSTLAKYFSRACTDTRQKFKYRAESVRRTNEIEKKYRKNTVKDKEKEGISKFSYSRGLYALKRRAANANIEKNLWRNKKSPLRLQTRAANVNLGMFLEGMDEGFESDNEGNATNKKLIISAVLRKNSKYQSADRINC